MRFPGEVTAEKALVRLMPNGVRDESFYNSGLGMGKLMQWNTSSFYVGTSQIVRRILMNGTQDPAFIEMNSGPYFSSLQGGDYYVYPDGRVLMGGRHGLSDSIRGFMGDHCLIWFSNTGYLDTTQHHRQCSGALYRFQELPDGKFIGSGSTSTWDGQPASNIFRFHADGALDTAFQANVWTGLAYGFLPLPDGRVYAAGNFRITGNPDTLQLVRFLPDGSLDPSFNTQLEFGTIELTGFEGGAILRSVYQLDAGRLVVMGHFELVEGQARRHICLIDTAGNLIDDHFTGPGCGNNPPNPVGWISGSAAGMVQAPDGSYYIYGSYHGYGDASVTDTLQRQVSRLHGFNVGAQEQEPGHEIMRVWPNPASGIVHVEVRGPMKDAGLVLRDAMGRMIRRQRITTTRSIVELSGLSPGLYLLILQQGGRNIAATKLLLE
ncbi:MAG: T9SS type A sorting domain-containing protein [Flavobacteriales bacterium]|nr:T9SS type A sorting domain-containing protein [Flavobacteriales bacterium]